MATPTNEIPEYPPQHVPRVDPRSTQVLLEIALANVASGRDEDEHAYWDVIGLLRDRATREVFEAARHLCESEQALEREVGVDILAQLGVPNRVFGEESLVIVLKVLEKEDNVDVLYSIGCALGHMGDAKGIGPLIKFKNHPDSKVRYGVAFGLCSQKDERAIDTLIELMSDEDSHVRDWATFGIGSLIDTDNETIRAALYERTKDPDPETSGEAIVGLARRKDPRVLDAIIADLEAGYVGSLVFEAAEELADPRLYPYLIKAKENWKNPDWSISTLNDAIAKCQEKRQD